MPAPGCLLDPFKSQTQTHKPEQIEFLMHKHCRHTAARISSNPEIISLTGLLITCVAQELYTACHDIILSFLFFFFYTIFPRQTSLTQTFFAINTLPQMYAVIPICTWLEQY